MTVRKRKKLTNQEKAVYENACDCLYYGYGFKYLNCCGLTEKEALRIWKIALENMATQKAAFWLK